MIKLIATDIDGTLVNTRKELPPNFDKTIRRLKSKGILFAVSSGRSLIALQEQFGKYINDISMICDNGALIVDRGKIISRSVIPKEKVIRIIDICYANGMTPLLCSPNTTFISDGDTGYHNEVALYYKKRTVLKDLRSFDGEVTKVAIYQEKGIENNGLELLNNEFGKDLTVTLSGYYWVDIMNAGISKGRGIEILQSRIGASYESTMAFGDYLNDIEMLNCAYYSYAMENAHPLVKTAANFQTGNNDDFAVINEIDRLVFKE